MLNSTAKILFLFALISCSFFARGQVTANFTLSDTAGCAPMVIHFTNTSTGATSYSWDLGNGTTTTLTDVSGSYLTAGVYTITLVAHNGSLSNTHTATIHVYALPTVNFTGSATTLCPGNSVTFTSTTIPGSWGGLTYNWNFGDGLTSSATSPVHAYGTPGDYNVTLFATNGKGCINSLSRPSYIHVNTPASVGFSAASVYLCNAPSLATFSNTTIGIGPFIYLWRFGDGGTSVLTNPTHNYTSSGTFDVTLRVTDGHGCIDSLALPGYMTVGNLAASFTPVSTVCVNSPATFINTSTTHIASSWDFGDGGTATDEDGTHAYATAGTYTVRLVIYDGTCYDTITHPVTISHPTGSFTITPTAPCPPPRLRTYTATIPSGSTVNWFSLIYGSLGSGSVLSHTTPVRIVPFGTDIVGEIDSITMVITNSFGCKDTVGKRDTTNSFTFRIDGVMYGCAPLYIFPIPTLYSQIYSPFAGGPWWQFGYPNPFSMGSFPYPYSIASYSWNFGDGSPTSLSPSPTHIYSVVGGVYTLSCHITSSNGCSQNATNTVKVGAPPPTPSFTLHPTHECAGVPVHFNATATGVFNDMKWDFGDSNGDTGLNPVHVYTTPGFYTPQFWTYYNGCPSSIYLMHDTVDSPSAVIHYNFDCYPRNKMSFSDASFGDDSHLWQFGDGATSTAFNPIHTYSSASAYTVTLTTWNAASGCRDTGILHLDMSPLHATFLASRANVCRDVMDTFSIAVTEAPGVTFSWATKYRWYYDGILTDSLVSTYGFDTVSHNYHSTGNRTAMVVITDNQGCNDSLSMNILVAKPVDSFSMAPVSGCAPLPVVFTDHSTPTPGSTLAGYYWSFGDGTTASSGVPSITHAYSLAGTYNVKEIITDNIGCMDTLVSHTHPVVTRPTAAFSAATLSICNHRSVHFINSSSSIIGSLWMFGDGDTSTATSPTHFYNTPGTYSVTLVVYSALGCTDTLTKTSYILVKPLPIPSFTMSDSFAVCSPFSVHFTNTSIGATTTFWTFGDGTSSSVTNPSDVYITPGYYRVKLLAINALSCSDTAIGHVNLFGYSGAFTCAPVTGCSPLPVHFHGTFSSVATVIWDFSDGVTSPPTTIDTISHTYLSSGAFVPKLILTDSFGCTNFSIGADTIKIGHLAVGFIATPIPVCQGNPITFHDTTSGSISPITSWLWTFGPGYTSTLSSPSFTYTTSGTYPVTLTATSSMGCSGTVTRNIVVNSLPSTISGASVICIGSTTPYTDASAGGVWTSSNIAVATVGSGSGIVSGIAFGVTTITYSLGAGCTVTKSVTVSPAPAPITGGSGVCAGSNLYLADVTPLGTWSSVLTGFVSVGSASGIITGLTTGTDTIIYSVGGCSVKKTITVNPLPAPITGNTHICVGVTSVLSSSPTGGIWTSSNTLVATVGSLTGIVVGISGGVANIIYTSAAGCQVVTTVTINTAPGTISGGSFICIGGTIPYTDIVTGGTWTSSNTGVATVGSLSGLVTGMGIGAASISYNAGGCSVLKIISVNALPPSISGPGTVCVSSAITLTDAAGGGVWTSSNNTVAVIGSSSGIVTAYASGNTDIMYSLGGGCVISVVLTVNPLPASISGPSNICLGGASALSDLTTGGVWYSDNTAVATVSTGGVVSGASGGAATISYTLSTGCASAYLVTVIVVPAITGLSNICAWVDTITVHDIDSTGSYSSTLVTITNLGLGTGRITAFAPGIATITYTLPGGCSATTPLTINPLPGPISGPMHLCIGSSATLIDTAAGGTWSASGTGIATIGSLSGVVSGLAVGTTHITYTLPTGCSTDTLVTIQVFPTAGVITGPSVLCTGESITLLDTAIGGVWVSSNANATVSGGVVTGVSTGTAVISYAVTNVCGTIAATKTVTVYPFPFTGTITGPDSVCVSSSITLTDTASGGAWGSNNTFATVTASGVVTGVMPGVDTIVYLNSNAACFSKSVHRVIVNPLPDAGVITGPSNLCLGDSAMLANTATGGVWRQSNNIVTMVSVTSGVKILPVNTGTDTIFYSVTNSCGTVLAYHLLTIETKPSVAAIAGLSVVCAGQNITLTDPTPGGLWTSVTSLITTIGSTSGVVTGMSPGTDSIIYTVSNACGSADALKQITVNPLPVAGTISGDSTLCAGDSVTLSDLVTGGTWSIENQYAVIKGSVIVTGVSAGTDMLSYSVTNSCGTTVATRRITIEPIPIGLLITRNGHVLSVPSGYAFYQWTLNGAPIPGATVNTYTYSGTGTFSVIVTNSFDCSFTCPAMVITDCTVDDIKVFPNPAASVVNILWCEDITVRLSAADGKLIRIFENTTEVDMSFLPNGIYTLSLFDNTGKKLLTKRITKLTQ